MWNEEELPEEKKEFITDSFQRKEVEMDSAIIGNSNLSTSLKFSQIHYSKCPYVPK